MGHGERGKDRQLKVPEMDLGVPAGRLQVHLGDLPAREYGEVLGQPGRCRDCTRPSDAAAAVVGAGAAHTFAIHRDRRPQPLQ